MNELVRRAIKIAAIVAAVILVFALVYSWLLPKLSFRRLVMKATQDDAIVSAELVNGSGETPLTDKQCIAVASWLAEYRSDNLGITHADEAGGYELRLHFAQSEKPVVLNVEQNAMIFPGILGQYRIEVDNNELYDLLANLVNG